MPDDDFWGGYNDFADFGKDLDDEDFDDLSDYEIDDEDFDDLSDDEEDLEIPYDEHNFYDDEDLDP